MPVVVVPDEAVPTALARARLPKSVTHADAAFTVARAALLGAALAGGSPALFAEALDDRLHEPYRARSAPLLAAIRDRLPAGALGATISGSGPTVVVWALEEARPECASELAERFPQARVLQIAVAETGAAFELVS
jgi:homoserine kinase